MKGGETNKQAMLRHKRRLEANLAEANQQIAALKIQLADAIIPKITLLLTHQQARAVYDALQFGSSGEALKVSRLLEAEGITRDSSG